MAARRTYKQYVLDPFQADALRAIERGESAIIAAPTGAGKTVVAEYAIERAIERGERIVYTAPIKALSNQKFRDFGAIHGARVGIMTGDVTINPSADALIMTTEIFRNTIFDNPARLQGIRYVILDEAHYLDDPERGTVWEESLIFAPPEIRFILLSATISNLAEFAAWIKKVRPGVPLRVIYEGHRPVPLHHFVFTGEEVLDIRDLGRMDWRSRRGRGRGRGWRGDGGGRPEASSFLRQDLALLDEIKDRDHLPVIFFLFSRDFCEKMAVACASRDFVTDAERRELGARWAELERDFELGGDPAADRVRRLLLRGVAYHHAGMLPTLKEVVERFFTSGLIKVLFATETFALGVNMPARSVAFESLKKFDGVKRDYMKTREFLQMAGRAGRRGIDDEGFVYSCVSPGREHSRDVRAVIEGEVEEVESQFNLAYATLLNLYSHLGEAIYQACEKSFIHFKYRKLRRRFGGHPFEDLLSQTKRRIALLEAEGYLDGRRLTEKGKFASLIYGYEVQAAELFAGGLLEDLSAVELTVLAAACVFESKRDAFYVPLRHDVLGPIRKRAKELLEPFCERERALGIRTQTKRLDWNLARATYEWARGADFASLAEWTDLSPGDLIRTFRLAIQLLRQLQKPLRFVAHDTAAFRRRIREAMACLKRDVVDAERQLRQAVKVEGGEEAAARIPHEVQDEVAEGEPRLDHVLAAAPVPAPEAGEPAGSPEDREASEEIETPETLETSGPPVEAGAPARRLVPRRIRDNIRERHFRRRMPRSVNEVLADEAAAPPERAEPGGGADREPDRAAAPRRRRHRP